MSDFDWFKHGERIAKTGGNLPSSHGKPDTQVKQTQAGWWSVRNNPPQQPTPPKPPTNKSW